MNQIRPFQQKNQHINWIIRFITKDLFMNHFKPMYPLAVVFVYFLPLKSFSFSLMDTMTLEIFKHNNVPGEIVADDFVQVRKEKKEEKNQVSPCPYQPKPFEELDMFQESGSEKKLELIALIGSNPSTPKIISVRKKPLYMVQLEYGEYGIGNIFIPKDSKFKEILEHVNKKNLLAEETLKDLPNKSFEELKEIARDLYFSGGFGIGLVGDDKSKGNMISQLAYDPGFGDFLLSPVSDKELNRRMASLLLLRGALMFDPEKLNDAQHNQELVDDMGGMIKKMNLSEKEQIEMIASIGETLGKNYNHKRANQRDNDSRYLGSQLSGLYKDDKNKRDMGGVCIDIAHVSCQLYEKINPHKECLIMGEAFHAVMLIADENSKAYTIVDYGLIDKVEGRNFKQMLTNTKMGTNIRLFKNNNGKIEPIANIKNEYGQWVADAISVEGKTGESLVRNLDGKLNNLTNQINYNLDQDENDGNTFELRGREGNLTTGEKITAIYAVIDQQNPNSKLHLSVGGIHSYKKNETVSARSENLPGRSLHQESIRNNIHISGSAGVGGEHDIKSERDLQTRIYHYSGAYVNLHHSAGSDTYHVAVDSIPNKSFFVQRKDDQSIDGDLGLSNSLGVITENRKTGTKVSLEGQFTHDINLKDISRAYGSQESSNFESTMKKIISNINFSLNRVEARAKVEQNITPQLTAVAGGQYLGTNVGQNILAEAGVTIENPDGMKYYVLTGYGARIAGFKTRQNYTPHGQDEGVSLKAGVATSQGDRFDAKLLVDPKNVQQSSLSLSGRIALDNPGKNISPDTDAAKILYRTHPTDSSKMLSFGKLNGVASWRVVDKNQENSRSPANNTTPYRYHFSDENKLEVLNPMSRKWEEVDKKDVPTDLRPQGSPNYSRYSFFAHPENPSKVLYFSIKNGKAKWTILAKKDVKSEHLPGPSSPNVIPYRRHKNGQKSEAYNPLTKKWEIVQESEIPSAFRP